MHAGTCAVIHRALVHERHTTGISMPLRAGGIPHRVATTLHQVSPRILSVFFQKQEPTFLCTVTQEMGAILFRTNRG